MDGSARAIHDLQAPSPPLVEACQHLGTKVLDSFQGGDRRRLDAGRDDALVIRNPVITTSVRLK